MKNPYRNEKPAQENLEYDKRSEEPDHPSLDPLAEARAAQEKLEEMLADEWWLSMKNPYRRKACTREP